MLQENSVSSFLHYTHIVCFYLPRCNTVQKNKHCLHREIFNCRKERRKTFSSISLEHFLKVGVWVLSTLESCLPGLRCHLVIWNMSWRWLIVSLKFPIWKIALLTHIVYSVTNKLSVILLSIVNDIFSDYNSDLHKFWQDFQMEMW